VDAPARLLLFLPPAKTSHPSLAAILPHLHLACIICIFTTLTCMLTVATMPTSARPPAVRGDRTSSNARTRRTLRTDDAMRSPLLCCAVLCCALPGTELLRALSAGLAFAAAGERRTRHSTHGTLLFRASVPAYATREPGLIEQQPRAPPPVWPFSSMAVPVVWPV
jgi:hypothetical protein